MSRQHRRQRVGFCCPSLTVCCSCAHAFGAPASANEARNSAVGSRGESARRGQTAARVAQVSTHLLPEPGRSDPRLENYALTLPSSRVTSLAACKRPSWQNRPSESRSQNRYPHGGRFEASSTSFFVPAMGATV
ncbi:hypothetical protein BDV96DRAFT_630252 [Lophiotrema nucula]|uniref:Uncharacterized protein n=1 Tax=Lophiotrema nucula TaxID=690887 RepID=A0A6A5ZH49_9PLEO|nr:hypothetical protein BDV96DRAFT_630252 [Lophiotrema nucula]